MTKFFKQLGRHWAACLAVVALLIVQAYCDLSLPDYTSKSGEAYRFCDGIYGDRSYQ